MHLNLNKLFKGRKSRSRKTTGRSRKSAGRRKGARKGLFTAQSAPWVLGLALVLVVLGVGALKWSRTRTGQASLLALGSDRMYGDVQAEVEKALRQVLPALPAGPVGTDQGAHHAADTDWPLPQLPAGAALRCRLVDVPAHVPFRELEMQLDRALAGVGGPHPVGRAPVRRRRPQPGAGAGRGPGSAAPGRGRQGAAHPHPGAAAPGAGARGALGPDPGRRGLAGAGGPQRFAGGGPGHRRLGGRTA